MVYNHPGLDAILLSTLDTLLLDQVVPVRSVSDFEHCWHYPSTIRTAKVSEQTSSYQDTYIHSLLSKVVFRAIADVLAVPLSLALSLDTRWSGAWTIEGSVYSCQPSKRSFSLH